MHHCNYNFDQVEWRRIVDESCKDYKIDFKYSLLGYDLKLKRLDMLLKYAPGNSHCRRHRHIASTMTIVLEGEQHLTEFQTSGTTKKIVRKKGDYALAECDALPNNEHGGLNGGTVILSLLSPDGNLFEYFGDNSNDRWTVSIEDFVINWKNGVIYGSKPNILTK